MHRRQRRHFPDNMIPADASISRAWRSSSSGREPNTTGLNYNYEVELPTVNTLIQQPAIRLDYQPVRGGSPASTPGSCAARSELDRRRRGARHHRAHPGFNDTSSSIRGSHVSVTTTTTLNPTTFIEGTYGWA